MATSNKSGWRIARVGQAYLLSATPQVAQPPAPVDARSGVCALHFGAAERLLLNPSFDSDVLPNIPFGKCDEDHKG